MGLASLGGAIGDVAGRTAASALNGIWASNNGALSAFATISDSMDNMVSSAPESIFVGGVVSATSSDPMTASLIEHADCSNDSCNYNYNVGGYYSSVSYTNWWYNNYYDYGIVDYSWDYNAASLY
jgi:hypothetical protein